MNESYDTVLKLIDQIKCIHDSKYVGRTGDCASTIFQYGHCFWFANMLNKFYPEGEYYIRKSDRAHIAYKIGNRLYDSIGMIYGFGLEDDYEPVVDEDWLVIETLMLPINQNEKNRLRDVYDGLAEEVRETYYSDINIRDKSPVRS